MRAICRLLSQIPFWKVAASYAKMMSLQCCRVYSSKHRKAALVGLGGIGKTQITQRLTYWIKEKKQDCSVFWMLALSHASLEQACMRIVNSCDIRRATAIVRLDWPVGSWAPNTPANGFLWLTILMKHKPLWVRQAQRAAYTDRSPRQTKEESFVRCDTEKWQYRLPGEAFSTYPQWAEMRREATSRMPWSKECLPVTTKSWTIS